MRLATCCLTAMQSRVARLSAITFFLLFGLGTCLGKLDVASSTMTGALTSHTLSAALGGAGQGSNWPMTTSELSAIASTVNETVCESMLAWVNQCHAFLMRVSETTLGLQLSLTTSSTLSGYAIYDLLSQWADKSSTAPSVLLAELRSVCSKALGTTLSSLTVAASAYTVPCRSTRTYSYLPACAPAEVSVTTVYILQPSSNVKAYFSAYLCGPEATTACTDRIVVQLPSGSSLYTVVTITGLPKALEAVLAYVADVRAAFEGSPQAVSPKVGNPSAGVTASAVALRYSGMYAVLFSTSENDRTYSPATRVTFECQASFAYWALVLIAVLPLSAILFRYVWYQGRYRAKKQERRRVVDDEMRIIQGYMNPGDAQRAGNGPPPGFDASATGISSATPKWVMDANGNYYDANAAADAGAVGNQTNVGPSTDEAYQYVAEDAHRSGGPEAVAAATVASQAPQQSGNGMGDKAIYQTYVDPETGETYQYPTNATATGQGQGESAEGPAAEHAGGDVVSNGYQTYVVPSTGDAYQYTTMDADAPSSGYQYVDPATGETYQYADANAESTYEYVDPATGETYQYPAEAAESNNEATGRGFDAADTGNIYADPNTRVTYQYDTLQR
ncbi:hypothetical protein JIQ42_02126 [Leishmania sp. Namibia]|uniref:hypothetical protein n=1 Tax=Leishmania sp. Namibia TaxID=2802991 RepID=UPI001B411559|nr:hypothetical protein JIQ42_02126 [Leishmania sp. Namibia]